MTKTNTKKTQKVNSPRRALVIYELLPQEKKDMVDNLLNIYDIIQSRGATVEGTYFEKPWHKKLVSAKAVIFNNFVYGCVIKDKKNTFKIKRLNTIFVERLKIE